MATPAAPMQAHQPLDIAQTDKWSEVMSKVAHATPAKSANEHSRPKSIKKKARKRKIAEIDVKQQASAKNAKPDALKGKIEPLALLAASDIAVNDNSAAKIEKERNLRKVATRGVVQLFNMLKKQQTTPVPPVEIKRLTKSVARRADSDVQAVTPRSFLELLAQSSRMQRQSGENYTSPKGADKSVPQLDVSAHPHDVGVPEVDVAQSTTTSSSNKNDGDKPKWNVLRNDYMMNAHLKDWDQAGDSDDEDET